MVGALGVMVALDMVLGVVAALGVVLVVVVTFGVVPVVVVASVVVVACQYGSTSHAFLVLLGGVVKLGRVARPIIGWLFDLGQRTELKNFTQKRPRS